MKICHLITRLILGGAQENTLLTLEGLKRDTSWDLHLAFGPEFGEEGSLVEKARNLGVILHPLRFLRRNLSLGYDLLAYEELLHFFEKERFDLVHTHSSKAGILGRIAARRAGIPRIVHTIHGLAFDTFQPVWKNAFYQIAERVAAENCDFLISVCETMKEQAIAAGVGSQSMIRTIYSGFPLDPFLVVKPRPKNGRFVIGMIARMFEFKGHEDLMNLAPVLLQEYPDMDFLIVGDGPMRRDWDRWLGAHVRWKYRFHFAERVFPEEVPLFMEQMDLLLHLSWREGLSRVIPQALVARRPVCVYDVGGAREIIKNGETGWIVPPGDCGKVLETVRMIRTNPEHARATAEKGCERVRELFGVEKMQKEILKLYCETSFW